MSLPLGASPMGLTQQAALETVAVFTKFTCDYTSIARVKLCEDSASV